MFGLGENSEQSMSGYAMVLNAMLPPEAKVAIAQIVGTKSAQRIIEFADGLEGLRADVRYQNALLICIAGKLGVSRDDLTAVIASGSYLGALPGGATAQPGSMGRGPSELGAANLGGTGEDSAGRSAEPGTHGGHAGPFSATA